MINRVVSEGRRGVSGWDAASWVLALAAGLAWAATAILTLWASERLGPADLIVLFGLAGVGLLPGVWLLGRSGGPRARWLQAAVGVELVLVAVGSALLLVVAATAGAGPTTLAGPGSTMQPTTGEPSSGPTPPAGVECPTRIQALVEAAAEGSTVIVPACIYRETVRIDRSITLRAEPGAEIRGSDIWTDWSPAEGGWRAGQAAPPVEARGTCNPGTTRCHVAQQVFVDGHALRLQETGRPVPGTFTIDPDGFITLGDDPAGRVVEVSVRELWVHVVADDVTIHGFKMRHSLAPAQSGGITAGGYGAESVDGLTVRDCRLSDAHGAIVSVQGGSDHRILDSRIERGGQVGLHLSGTPGSRNWQIAGNVIRDNSTAGFDVGWEAGGLKSLHVDGLEIADNEFAGGPNGDNGRGAWTDTGSRNVVFVRNRMSDNGYEGAFFESTHGLLVADNVAWNNGWLGADWAWGGGIVLASSDHAVVRDNVLAWNADGISVISQDRDDDEAHVDIAIEDNTIFAIDRPSDHSAYATAWVQDWAGILFDPASGNRGNANRYWFSAPESGTVRFAWDGPYRSLAEFAGTPGGAGSRYLSDDEARSQLEAFGLPGPPGVTTLDATWPLAPLGVRLIALGSLLAALGAVVAQRGLRRVGPLAIVAGSLAMLPATFAEPSGLVASFGLAWALAAALELVRLLALRRRLASPDPRVPD